MTLNLRPSSTEESNSVTYRRKPDGHGDPAGETGWFLQREREQRGKTLADAALETHISAKYLHAIEMGVLQDLPAQSYILGYIRVYAEFLGLEADPLLEQYKGLLSQSAPARTENRRGERSKMFVLVAASTAFLAVMTGIIWYAVPGVLNNMTDGLAEAPLETEPSAVAEAQSDPIETGSVDPNAPSASLQEAADAIEEILDDAVPTVIVRQEGFDDGSEPVPDTGLQPADLDAVAPAPGDDENIDDASRLTEFIRQHVTEEESVGEQTALGIVYGAENESARIILIARRPVWIRIEDAEGRIMITRTMQTGDSYRVPDMDGLVLIARDGGALDYSIDGRDKGALGAPGEIVVGRPLDIGAMNSADG